MHDDALAGLVQGGHQLLGDDHLADLGQGWHENCNVCGESKTYQRMDCGRVELEKVGQYRLGVKEVMKCESQGRV